ncbi:tRNA glutamyl-Q(34) synthetase GluQRS [Paracoccaceae bacterium GXU_MW_L88]
MTVERFAPSPTGPLHLGHAFSALTAYDAARSAGGRFLLRIEDIDQGRARAEWEALIYEDLAWLGITWETPVMRQSERLDVYHETLKSLWDRALIYPCSCNRKDIATALSAPQEGAPMGPDGPVYPGTCRDKPRPKAMPGGMALRLDMRKAAEAVGPVAFTEIGEIHGTPEGTRHEITPAHLIENIGDVVLGRKDMGTSYHLSVVLDDAAQDVTHVTRGADLFEATAIHVLLQKLLGLPTPIYRHHRLIRDENGKRLAKRDDARAIRLYREDGVSPSEIRSIIGQDGAGGRAFSAAT